MNLGKSVCKAGIVAKLATSSRQFEPSSQPEQEAWRCFQRTRNASDGL